MLNSWVKEEHFSVVMALPGDRIAVLSSGRSDDLQNLEGSDRRAIVLIGDWYRIIFKTGTDIIDFGVGKSI